MAPISPGVRPTDEELGRAVRLFVDAIIRAAQQQLDEQKSVTDDPTKAPGTAPGKTWDWKDF